MLGVSGWTRVDPRPDLGLPKIPVIFGGSNFREILKMQKGPEMKLSCFFNLWAEYLVQPRSNFCKRAQKCTTHHDLLSTLAGLPPVRAYTLASAPARPTSSWIERASWTTWAMHLPKRALTPGPADTPTRHAGRPEGRALCPKAQSRPSLRLTWLGTGARL